MKNTIRTFLACSAIAVTGLALPALASEMDPMHVKVPFAFKAGKTELPAGEYVVVEGDSGVILIKGSRGTAMLLGTAGTDALTDKASVTFDHNESGYVLKSVHQWGRTTSSVLPVAHNTEK